MFDWVLSKRNQATVTIGTLTHYNPLLLIYTPWKLDVLQGLLMFSGEIDKQHRFLMG